MSSDHDFTISHEFKLQHDTDTVQVQQGETSIQIAIEMPFDIRSIDCPTNKIRMKVRYLTLDIYGAGCLKHC